MVLREFFTSKKLKISLWKIRTETSAMLVFRLKSKDCFPLTVLWQDRGGKETAEDMQNNLKGTEAAS